MTLNQQIWVLHKVLTITEVTDKNVAEIFRLIRYTDKLKDKINEFRTK